MSLNQRKIIWSYGGGVQSIAILVLIAQGKLPKPELAIMADTGRERSSTWRYLEQHAEPLMEEIGLSFKVVNYKMATVDLYGHNGDLLLPAFTQSGKLPTFCSSEWKKLPVRRALRQLGYGPKNPITLWLGMSLDEIHRLRQSDKKWIENYYPLCFDTKLRRHECILEIERFGLPEPPSSACWMCPNLDNAEWQQIKRDDPKDWQKAVTLDYKIRQSDRQGGVFLHSDAKPLDKADLTIKRNSSPLWECANGCFT